MRRLLIGFLLPMLLCTLPFLAAAWQILVCIPHEALFALLASHFPGLMEALIVGGGVRALRRADDPVLAGAALARHFVRRRERSLGDQPRPGRRVVPDARPDRHRRRHSRSVRSQRDQRRHPAGIIAPAITATGSGLFMALINILPAWIVLLGRDMILLVAGAQPKPPGEAS